MWGTLVTAWAQDWVHINVQFVEFSPLWVSLPRGANLAEGHAGKRRGLPFVYSTSKQYIRTSLYEI